MGFACLKEEKKGQGDALDSCHLRSNIAGRMNGIETRDSMACNRIGHNAKGFGHTQSLVLTTEIDMSNSLGIWRRNDRVKVESCSR